MAPGAINRDSKEKNTEDDQENGRGEESFYPFIMFSADPYKDQGSNSKPSQPPLSEMLFCKRTAESAMTSTKAMTSWY